MSEEKTPLKKRYICEICNCSVLHKNRKAHNRTFKHIYIKEHGMEKYKNRNKDKPSTPPNKRTIDRNRLKNRQRSYLSSIQSRQEKIDKLQKELDEFKIKYDELEKEINNL